MAENPPENARYASRYDERDDEAIAAVLHAVYEIHAKEAGYERGEHQYYGHRGERSHHSVHVVVDDARVCVHG